MPANGEKMFYEQALCKLSDKILNLENADIERSKKFLLEAGATEIFTIGLNDEEGLEAIKKRLVMNEF